jgi:GT2 family glycosyltransferase
MISFHMEPEESPGPPQVSVLIVSYNSAEPLRRCLGALESSAEREKFEILVVDCGSVDESPGLDSEFPNATFLRLPRNFGFTKAANIGMRTAKGEFIFFLDPVVEVLPETVSSLAARLEGEPEAVAVCPLLVSPEGEPVGEVRKLPDREGIAAAWREGHWGPGCELDLSAERLSVGFPSFAALMVRSYFLRGLRYIDERYGESWGGVDICFQILRASRKILLFPGIRAVRHAGEGRSFPAEAGVQALLSADWVMGAATYAAKRYGFRAGLKVRLAAVFSALGQALLALVRFRDVGYHFSRSSHLLGGHKLDGTQRGL